MFKWLQNLKTELSSSQTTNKEQGGTELAMAVLLVEVMHADHVFDEREEEITVHLLQQQCNISQSKANDVYRQACRVLNDAVSLHEYTSLLHSELSYEKKFALLVGLWMIAMADNDIDRYEEHLVRKIAELLYISHKDFIRAKHLAMEQTR